jgi:hypothetical protein
MRHKAIYITHPTVVSIDDGLGAFDKNGNSVDINEAKVAEEIKRLEAEYNSKQYQRDRAVAYDPIPEQLDQIYHDIDGWKAKIKAVKDKFPKPSE